MKPQQTQKLAGTVAFLAAITAYAVLAEVVVPRTLGQGARVTLLALSSVGVYATFYNIAQWLLGKRLFAYVSNRGKLAGKWHQVFVISGSPESVNYRHGDVFVEATLDGTVLAGSTFRPDGSYSSHWQSQAVLPDGRTLDLMFASVGMTRGRTSGTMSLLVAGTPPDQIIGTWADSAPSTNCGEIRLFKSTSAADEYISGLAGS